MASAVWCGNRTFFAFQPLSFWSICSITSAFCFVIMRCGTLKQVHCSNNEAFAPFFSEVERQIVIETDPLCHVISFALIYPKFYEAYKIKQTPCLWKWYTRTLFVYDRVSLSHTLSQISLRRWWRAAFLKSRFFFCQATCASTRVAFYTGHTVVFGIFLNIPSVEVPVLEDISIVELWSWSFWWSRPWSARVFFLSHFSFLTTLSNKFLGWNLRWNITQTVRNCHNMLSP